MRFVRPARPLHSFRMNSISSETGTALKRLEGRVWRRILRDGLLSHGQTVLVACSGGSDSTFLTIVLHRLAWRLDLTCVVAHVDHGLRSDSAQDARWVCEFAHGLGLDCLVERVVVVGSGEDAARKARLCALEGLADRVGADVVALGHHADDQAETVLMRMVRGTGLRGLAAMAPRRGRFVRPLLDLRRGEIETALSESRIGFVEDATNASSRFFRNRVRGELIDWMRRENPAVVQGLSGLARNIRADLEAFDAAMEIVSESWVIEEVGPDGLTGTRVARELWERLGAGGIWWAIRRAHAAATVGRRSVGQLERVHVAGLLDGLSRGFDGPSRRFSLPGGVTILLGKWGLTVVPGDWLDEPAKGSWTVTGPGRWRLDMTGWIVDVGASRALEGRGLFFRTRRPGDRVSLRGHHRKLQDLLVDSGVPAPLRNRLPLVVGRDGIVEWVPHLHGNDGTVTLWAIRGSLDAVLSALFDWDHGKEEFFDLSVAPQYATKTPGSAKTS